MGVSWCCCHNVVFLFVFFILLVLGPWSDVFFDAFFILLGLGV